jgi:protein SCO1/2
LSNVSKSGVHLKHLKERFIAAAAVLCALAGVTVVRTFADSTSPSRWGADYFPNVTLTTQFNKQVKFYDDLLKGKKVAIYLMYTTCKFACPLETARLAQVQRYLGDRVGKDIFFYSITIDPKHDTPQVLKSYAEQFHAGPGWLFLTGKESDIDLISKKLGLYTEPDTANQDGHTPSLLIGDERGGQWMVNSALDNPHFLALMIGQFLDSWNNPVHSETHSYAEAEPIKFDRGQYVFGSKCAACHTIGRGDGVGPDLLNVTSAREHTWLTHYLTKPDEMLAHGDPIATALFKKYKQVRMPNLGLDPVEIESVIHYLDRKVLYFACPMHTHVHSDKPGKAPCCGMRFEPVFAQDAPREGEAGAGGSAQK